MTHAASVTRGLDLDTFEGVAVHVAEHPADVRLGLEARSTDRGPVPTAWYRSTPTRSATNRALATRASAPPVDATPEARADD